MGQKPRLPRSITLTKTVKIRVRITQQGFAGIKGEPSFNSKEWSEFLSDINAANSSRKREEFANALESAGLNTILDMLIKSYGSVVVTYNDKRKTPLVS